MNVSNNSSHQTPRAKTTVAPVTVIRFGEMMPDWGEYHESRMEGNHRAIYRYIGGISGQNLRAPLPGWEFTCGVVMTPPQNGAPLHDHPDEEIFMVWEGEFEIFWEDFETKTPKNVVLGQYDLIRVPSGVMRGFRNVGKDDGFIHFIHGQGDYQYPVYPVSLQEGLPEGVRTEAYVNQPAYDPATQLVRFEECPRNWSVYHEAKLPEGVRSLRRYIGGVSGDTDEGPPPSLSEGEIGYAMVECGNGRGAPLHDHPMRGTFYRSGRQVGRLLGGRARKHPSSRSRPMGRMLGANRYTARFSECRPNPKGKFTLSKDKELRRLPTTRRTTPP